MIKQVKNGTSLFRLYDLIFLQKIRDSKPNHKTSKTDRTQPEMLEDAFGQMVYSLTVKPGRKNNRPVT